MCPGKMVLALSLVNTLIGVPRKVVYPHDTTAYFACLSVVFVAFGFGCDIA